MITPSQISNPYVKPTWQAPVGVMESVVAYNCRKYGMPVPVLALPMWEGAGDCLTDLSGHGNHGDIDGAVWEGSDRGIGLDFDGTSDDIDCGNAASLNITDAITINFWVKCNTTSYSYDRLFCKGTWKGYQIFTATDDRLYFRIFTGGTTHDTPISNSLGLGVWKFITVTYDKDAGANNQKLYIDGIIDKQTTTTGAMDPGTDNVSIGSALAGNWFEGSMNNAIMYNCALSDEQIKFLYNNPHFMFRIPEKLYGYAAGVIMNQFQKANIGADLYNGAIIA